MSPILLYIQTCINLGYYLFVIPFKIVPKTENKGIIGSTSVVFKIYTPIYRQVLCAIVYGFVLFHQFFFPSDVRILMPATYGPLSYLGLFRKVLCILYVICAINIFWRRHNLLLKVYKIIQESPFISGPNVRVCWKSTIFVKAVIVSSYVWYIYVFPLELFLDVGKQGSIGLHLNATTALNRIYSRSQRIRLRTPEEIETVTYAILTYDQTLHSFLYFILFLFTTVVQTILESLVLHSIFLSWHYVARFQRWYKKQGREAKSESADKQLLEKVLVQYDAVNKLILTMNKFIGPAIVVVIALYLPIYAVYAGLITIKRKFTTHALVVTVMHYAIYFLQMGIAAEIHRNGNSFIYWVSSPRFLTSISPRRLTSLSMDVHSQKMALKGSGCFNLTYRFLSSILGVMITYAVLVVQFQDGRFGYHAPENRTKCCSG